MKKILFTIALLVMTLSVSASTGTSEKNINIENIKVTIPEAIGYNEELKVQYTINPLDASNTNLDWSITGTKTGVTAEFSSKITTTSEGELTIKINNTTDKEVSLKLVAKQNGKTITTTELKIETKDVTIERVTGEVTDLINGLDEKINKKNYEENKEALEKIEKSLNANKEVEELVDKDLLVKYDDVQNSMTKYEESQGKTLTIIISIVLVLLFIFGMFLIFKKEEK